MRTDPRIRQNLDRISNSLETAADNVSTSCFTFTKSYIEPCLSSLTACCPTPTKHHRRRPSHRGRQSEYPFGFYDYDDEYPDDDEAPGRGGGILAWGTDELDRLLAGSSAGRSGREVMYYGTSAASAAVQERRKSTLPLHHGRDSPDPTVIPGTSMFGFLSRFGVRGKGMRYKPSAANLQEHPQRGGLEGEEVGDSEEVAPLVVGRRRAGTGSSGGSGGESLRSRGDLWPSEDEDDAVVIGDDAFPRSSDGESGLGMDDEEMRHEEARIEQEEEEELMRKREKAQRLAVQRGLSVEGGKARATSPHSGDRRNSSAPPTILSASPEPYGTTIPRPGSASMSPVRTPGSPRPRAASPLAFKEVEEVNTFTPGSPIPRLTRTRSHSKAETFPGDSAAAVQK